MTKKRFEDMLNETSGHTVTDDYIIGGRMRYSYFYLKHYGSALRSYDPIQFNILYVEWKVRTIRLYKKLKLNK